MKDYFLLQYKMANRKLIEWGINPFIAYVLIAVGFILGAEYLFIKTEYAEYIIVALAVSLLTKTAETNRSQFLQMVFGNSKFRQIRIIENLTISLPFAIVLVYHQAVIEPIALLVGSALLAGFSFKVNLTYAIPTPFYKKPFEFIVGFRNTFYLFLISYALVIIALSVSNLNLALFGMLSVFGICLTYYNKPEDEYYVWVHVATPAKFILNKTLTATLQAALLALPAAISIIAFYPAKTDAILFYVLIGYAFLWAIILAKYAAYPNPIGLPQAMLIAFCIYYPPIVLALVPYFYYKCIKNLYPLLK